MSQYDFKRKATFWKNIDCDILKKKSIYEKKANSKKKGIFGQKKSNSEKKSNLRCIVGHVVYGQCASVK